MRRNLLTLLLGVGILMRAIQFLAAVISCLFSASIAFPDMALVPNHVHEVSPADSDSFGIDVTLRTQQNDCWNATKVMLSFPEKRDGFTVKSVHLDISNSERIVFRRVLYPYEWEIIGNKGIPQTSFCVQSALLPESRVEIHYGGFPDKELHILKLGHLSSWVSAADPQPN